MVDSSMWSRALLRHDGEQRQRDEADHDREQDPGALQRVAASSANVGAGPVGDRVTGDHVDVEAGRLTGEPGDERSMEELVPAAAPADTEHELSGVGVAGEFDERSHRVVADDLEHLAAELADELALLLQRRAGVTLEAVVDGDVHSDELAAEPAGHA